MSEIEKRLKLLERAAGVVEDDDGALYELLLQVVADRVAGREPSAKAMRTIDRIAAAGTSPSLNTLARIGERLANRSAS